jgi:hypothetical protein
LKQISITLPETAHWHALIGKAEHIASHLLPQGIEDYLIRLFIRIEQEEIESFSSKYKELIQTDTTSYKLQRLADQCLMLCGFYPEASEDYGVAIDEFISMGTEAYRKLASMEYGENEIIFEYLSENFEQVSNLLGFINNLSDKSVSRQSYITVNSSDKSYSSLTQLERISFSSPISHRVLN